MPPTYASLTTSLPATAPPPVDSADMVPSLSSSPAPRPSLIRAPVHAPGCRLSRRHDHAAGHPPSRPHSPFAAFLPPHACLSRRVPYGRHPPRSPCYVFLERWRPHHCRDQHHWLHFSGLTPYTIPTQPPLHSPTVSHSAPIQLAVPLWLPPPAVTSLSPATSCHLWPSAAVLGPLSSSSTSSNPMPLLGTMKAAPLVGSPRDFPLHVARPPSTTVVTTGQVPLGLVCPLPRPTPTEFKPSLLLPVSYSSSPNSHHHDHLLHRLVARAEQMTPSPC